MASTNPGAAGSSSDGPSTSTYVPGPRGILKRRPRGSSKNDSVDGAASHSGIRWDEENIMSTEADRGNKMKILEPKTPFIHYNLSTDEIVGSTGTVPPLELNSAIQRARSGRDSDGSLSSIGRDGQDKTTSNADPDSLPSELEHRMYVSDALSSVSATNARTARASSTFSSPSSDAPATPSEWQSEDEDDRSRMKHRHNDLAGSGSSMETNSASRGSGHFLNSIDDDDDDDDDDELDEKDRVKRQKFQKMRAQHYNMKNVLARARELLDHDGEVVQDGNNGNHVQDDDDDDEEYDDNQDEDDPQDRFATTAASTGTDAMEET